MTSLDLSYNDIGKEEAVAIAEALKNNSTLTFLNLTFKEIGIEGAVVIAEALKKNSTLTSLDLPHGAIAFDVVVKTFLIRLIKFT